MDYNKRLLRLDIKSAVRIDYADYIVDGIIKFEDEKKHVFVRYNLYSDVNGDKRVLFVDEYSRDIFFFKPCGIPKELSGNKIILEKIGKKFYNDLTEIDAIGNIESNDLQECNYEFRYYGENRIIGIVNEDRYLVGSMLMFDEVEILIEKATENKKITKKDAGAFGSLAILGFIALIEGYRTMIFGVVICIFFISALIIRKKNNK